MIIADHFTDYAVLDTGDGMKLERWAGVTLARPDPQVIWNKSRPSLWATADAVYHRSSAGGGTWEFRKKLPDRWVLTFGALSFYVRPTGFKHTGLFPEQSANWEWISKRLASRPGARVLNLFAYTGGATLACAAAGASVAHVDAAKSMIAWARENAALSGLKDASIRYLADDCLTFVLREQRRGNRYDGIIMDPPSYGRGAGGQVWKLEENLPALVFEAAKLLSADPAFFIISSYTTGLSSVVTRNLLLQSLPAGTVEAGDLCLPVEGAKTLLPCGTTARWQP